MLVLLLMLILPWLCRYFLSTLLGMFNKKLVGKKHGIFGNGGFPGQQLTAAQAAAAAAAGRSAGCCCSLSGVLATSSRCKRMNTMQTSAVSHRRPSRVRHMQSIAGMLRPC
jgi:hypothetical protein